MEDPDNEKLYLPFMVNRGLSFFADTVLLANEMNINYQLPVKLQYEFLKSTVRKRKRFSKWYKGVVEDKIKVIKDYYGYSTAKAIEVEPLLTDGDILIMQEEMNHGGVSK